MKGPDSLPPAKRSYYMQLRDQLATPEGRAEYRDELMATCATIVGLLAEEIREQHDAGRPVSNIPATRSIGTFINSAARLLADYPKPDKTAGRTLKDVIESMSKPQTKPEGASSTSPSDSGALKPNGEAT